MVSNEMEKTTLYLPADLQRSLREVARRTGRSQAELIRDALVRYLQDHPRPSLRSVGMGEDPELSGRDSERWLQARWDAG
jgi:predicted DNA-binding protein